MIADSHSGSKAAAATGRLCAPFSIGLQFLARGDERDGSLHFLNRPERVARAVDEQRGRAERREMRGSSLLRRARRVERVRQQHQCVRRPSGILGGDHRALAPSIGMSGQDKRSTRKCLTQLFGGAPDSIPILCLLRGVQGGRALLPEGQVTPKHRVAAFRQRLRSGDQKWSVAV